MSKNQKAAEDATVTCPICGRDSPTGSARCANCYTDLAGGKASGPDDAKTGKAPEDAPDLNDLLSVPGVGTVKAEVLKEAGYTNLKDLEDARVEDLASIKGIGEKLATKIIEGARAVSRGEAHGLADWLSGEDEGLSDWLSGEEQAVQPEPAAATEADVHYSDSLARWLSGKEEDLNSWLEEPVTAPKTAVIETHPQELLEKESELIQLRETLKEKLRLLETGEFDPQATIEELARTKVELESERSTRMELEEELNNVKRGSIAVIKFIKGQKGTAAESDNLADRLASEMALRENLELKIMELEGVLAALREKVEGATAELPPDIQELKRLENALTERQAMMDAFEKQLESKEEVLKDGIVGIAQGSRAGSEAQDHIIQQVEEFSKKEQEYLDRVHDLEAKLSAAELDFKQRVEMAKLTSAPSRELDAEVTRKLEGAQRTERTLALREQEAAKLREELTVRDDDMRKLKEPLAYKEAEMLRREEDLMYREKLLQEELRNVTQQKAELTSTDELTLKRRLEDLQGQVTQKEEEVRSKEKYLSAKEEELRAREQGLIGDEIEKRETDRMLEIKQEKVKTGTTRLDDLLLGGIPFGSNVMIYGPPFAGKEVLVDTFVAEGLKKGIPAMWIITEKSPKEIREEMVFVVPGYEEYEKRGLVRYIDSYSRSMGDESQDPYTDYVESPTDYESVQKAVEKVAKEFKKDHEYYRVAFRSISTMIAYLDPNTAFRFLSPIAGRRKRDRAVGMYTIEKGVHGDQEIQMLGSLMDGMIEFKIENLNTFLSIKGICDVQSRAFIRYSSTKSNVSIGSFSLDHIR